MLTDFTRDALFTTGWFGLMAVVWFGWAQEDPPARWRARLGAGSVLGLLLTAGATVLVVQRWADPSALEGRYPWFGVLVGTEVLAAGAGCWVLARRGRSRWMAWWVALVVALHFIPLAFLLSDPTLAVAGGALAVVLGLLVPRLRRRPGPTSSVVGAVMGASLLGLSVLAGGVALV